MKTSLLILLCAAAFALPVSSQTPALSPQESTAASPAPALSSTPSPATSPAVTAATAIPNADEDFDTKIEKKLKKHFHVSVNDHDVKGGDDSDVPWIAIPIVLIVFLAIFGTPVMIVGLIMYFSFSRSRALHRTVQMMVEKGQPVPEALLNPPPAQRQRSDLRRGVVFLMIGIGLMVFFAAVSDWEGGAWSLGIIPFLIGAGYLLVWKLDARKEHVSPPV